ncbi:DUF6770 family protein [Aquimarina gracilis]|uniref:DUF6770 family protein n=1 Tax=Aquimarina gracilis TaxID=874422 RepID=A0ABU5ZWV9_9FLAO|nr:DUF6770 family protein [Aquimarina gracilis]MEB3346341.1 DUF6770 family protein [Aquimarina gracilis]
MKKTITLFLMLLCLSFASAQEKTINEITSFKIRNSGTLMDKTNNVDGYYFFYEVDKLKKGQKEYAIQILDNNLNDVATKSYVDNKNTFLVQSKFNNQALIFAMTNYKEKFYKLITFDRQANQVENIQIPVSKKEMRWLNAMKQTGNFNFLFPVDNKGFLFNYVRDNSKLGYGLKYVPTDGGTGWDYNSPEDSKLIHTLNPIEANEEVVVALEGTKKSLLSQTINYKVIVLDIKTGAFLFESKFDRKDNPRLVTNAFLTPEKNLVLLGEYFEAGDNIMKDKSLGLFSETLDLKGNIVSDSKISWVDKIDPMMPAEIDGKKKKKRGYIYFHDIVRTQKGTYYAIGERYRKTASAGGIAAMALSGGRSGNSVTQLTITNAAIFEFDEKFNLTDIKVFEKGKSRAPSITDFGSPQLNAHVLKSFGAFDYEFTQLDQKRDRFYATFIDYERLKGQKNKTAFKTVMYNAGSFSEDKIYLQEDKGRTQYRVMPGKLGNVMLLEYNKKDKTVQLHLEKLNVQ